MFEEREEGKVEEAMRETDSADSIILPVYHSDSSFNIHRLIQSLSPPIDRTLE
jgi:hypothetical protein